MSNDDGAASDESARTLTVAEVNNLVQDDIDYWMNNPFMDRAALVDKVCWWISRAVRGASDV